MMDSINNNNNNNQKNQSKLITSYQYLDYPPTDLCIYSSLHQDSLNNNDNNKHQIGFDESTNKFKFNHQQNMNFPKIIIYFIPGNPGLIEFYHQFFSDLSSLFSLNNQNEGQYCQIISTSHLGHSLKFNSNLDFRFLNFFNNNNNNFGSDNCLENQVDYHCHVVKNLIDNVISDTSDTKLVVIGHSVGAYIATKVLEKYPERVAHMIGLFPTISNIGRSKNGRLMAPLFSPISLPFINLFQIILSAILPKIALCYLINLFFRLNQSFNTFPIIKSQPSVNLSKKINVVDDDNNKNLHENYLLFTHFIYNINTVSEVLKMARSEMRKIKELDRNLINKFKKKLTFIWSCANGDDWVEEKSVMEILNLVNKKNNNNNDNNEEKTDHPVVLDAPTVLEKPNNSDNLGGTLFGQNHQVLPHFPLSKRMQVGIPHAFCLNHNQIMAHECFQLINSKFNLFI